MGFWRWASVLIDVYSMANAPSVDLDPEKTCSPLILISHLFLLNVVSELYSSINL